jgi:hypothetical protein
MIFYIISFFLLVFALLCFYKADQARERQQKTIAEIEKNFQDIRRMLDELEKERK